MPPSSFYLDQRSRFLVVNQKDRGLWERDRVRWLKCANSEYSPQPRSKGFSRASQRQREKSWKLGCSLLRRATRLDYVTKSDQCPTRWEWTQRKGYKHAHWWFTVLLMIRERRTASLWSWHSEGDSSPDEMPDYDSMKSKKQAERHQDIERDECKYLGYNLKSMLNVVSKIFLYCLS